MKLSFLRWHSCLNLALILLILACTPQSTINIAYVGPLASETLSYSSYIIQAMTMAIDEVNTTGGINGRVINLVLGDTEAESMTNLLRDLLEVDQIVAAIGPPRSPAAMRLIEPVNEFHLPIISPAATNPALTLQSPYFFRTIASDAMQTRVLATYVYDILGISHLSILSSNDDYSGPMTEYFVRNYTDKGGTIDYAGVMPAGARDVSFYIDKVVEAGSKALLLPLDVAEASIVLHQLSRKNIKLQLIGGDTFSNPNLFALTGKKTEGLVYSSPPIHGMGVDGSKVENFERQYLERFGDEPDNYARTGYDATRLLLEAIKRVAKQTTVIDRDILRDEISETKDFEGISGIINFDDNGDIYRGIEMVTIIGNQRKSKGIYNVQDGQLLKLR